MDIKKIIEISYRILIFPNELIARIISVFFRGIIRGTIGLIIHFILTTSFLLGLVVPWFSDMFVELADTEYLEWLDIFLYSMPESVQTVIVLFVVSIPIYISLFLTNQASKFYYRRKKQRRAEA